MKIQVGGVDYKIRMLRLMLKMSQTDFAKSININQSMLSRYESGQTTPTADVLIAISKTYGVSVNWLCDMDFDYWYSAPGDFARFLIEMEQAENVYPVISLSNTSETEDDPRGPYAEIRFYRDDSDENTAIYEMLLQAIDGNFVRIDKYGTHYNIDSDKRDFKAELEALENNSLPVLHNPNRFPKNQ